MRIGILNAIHPDTSTVDWGGSPVDAYIRFFQAVNAPFDYIGYKVAEGELPASTDSCDAYVITGSNSGVYDDDAWIPALSNFIRDCFRAGQKLIGICFGHQILAHALGGHAEKSEKGWGLGLKPINILQSQGWMSEKPDQCSLYFAHQDQVIHLPPEAELLGGSEFCPNALFTIKDQVFGIQGHPEFSTEIMRNLLDVKDNSVEPNVIDTAVKSLENGWPDNQLMGRWMVNFLVGKNCES